MGLFDIFKNKKDNDMPSRENIKEKAIILEDLLRKSANESGLWPSFYKAILSSELIVLTDKASKNDGQTVLKADTSVNIVSFKDGKIPAFTSTDRIFDKGVIKNEVPFIGLNGRDLLELTKGDALILNPFSDFGKEFTPDEIKSLLDGTLFNPNIHETTKDTRVQLGIPAQLPVGFENSLIEFSKTRIEIDSTYVAIIDRIDSGEGPNLIVGLKIESNEKEIFGELSNALRPYVKNGKHIELTRITGTGGLSSFFNKIEPIYKK